MTGTDIWTQDRVLAELLAICEENPDTVNPVVPEMADTCVYDDDDGRNCLVGKFLVRNDLPLPPVNGSITGIILGTDNEGDPVVPEYRVLADDDVYDLLQTAQNYADGQGTPETWGMVGSLLHAEYGDPRLIATEGNPK